MAQHFKTETAKRDAIRNYEDMHCKHQPSEDIMADRISGRTVHKGTDIDAGVIAIGYGQNNAKRATVKLGTLSPALRDYLMSRFDARVRFELDADAVTAINVERN